MLCPLICFTKKTLPLPEGVTQQGDAVRKSLCGVRLAVRMAGGVSLHGIPLSVRNTPVAGSTMGAGQWRLEVRFFFAV